MFCQKLECVCALEWKWVCCNESIQGVGIHEAGFLTFTVSKKKKGIWEGSVDMYANDMLLRWFYKAALIKNFITINQMTVCN